MKKIFVWAMITLLLVPALAAAETYHLTPDNGVLIVGTDLPAGDYVIEHQGSEYWTYCVKVPDGPDVVPVEVRSSKDTTTAYVTLEDGQWFLPLLVSDGETMTLTPVSSDEKADADAADPYKHIIEGVDVKLAIKRFEEYYENNPLSFDIVSISVFFSDKQRGFGFNLEYKDNVDISGYTSYIPELLRRFNTLCYEQNTSIKTASPTSYGGVFDAFDAYVSAYNSSSLMDSDASLSTFVPAGSHGYANIDVNGLE